METLYTISEVAEKLHKSEISISRWIRDGKLSYIQVSERRRLISESQLSEFLAKRVVIAPKRIDNKFKKLDDLPNCSLKIENGDLDVKSLKKEIERLCL